MKCYCYETDTEFIYCVEDAKGKIYENLLADEYWTKSDNDKFTKTYPLDTGWEDAWYSDPEYKEAIRSNFSRLGESWLKGEFDWRTVLSFLIKKFMDSGIEWYIIGSTSEAVLGVSIIPHDIDIVVHTSDFYKVRDLFCEYTVEPLGDNKGNWLVRYFGKLCIDGASVDIAADDKMNLENNQHAYEKASWSGYDVYIEPLQNRYEVETARNRKDRIKAIEAYMNKRDCK